MENSAARKTCDANVFLRNVDDDDEQVQRQTEREHQNLDKQKVLSKWKLEKCHSARVPEEFI